MTFRTHDNRCGIIKGVARWSGSAFNCASLLEAESLKIFSVTTLSYLPRWCLQECILEDPNVVDEVDTMMSTIGMEQVSARATSALSSAKAWFTGKKRTDLFI